MPFELDRSHLQVGANIKIIGVGGCGGNAVNNMIERGIEGVEFIAFNTDQQALSNSLAQRFQIGKSITKGLGAGFNPEIGKKAAEEDREQISELLRGTDMLFITAGMGKGTGTGAAPVIAGIAKNLGILTIGIVTKPFEFEGRRTMETAERGIEELRRQVDTLIVVQNEKILSFADGNLSIKEAYNLANDVLYRAAKGISEIITKHGHVNVDFADVRNVMTDAGDAVMGSATASGENRALKAAMEAISSPLLDGVSIRGSSRVLVNLTGDIKIRDAQEAMHYIYEQAGSDATIIHGIVEDDSVPGEISVTVIATGFNKTSRKSSSAAEQLRVVRREELVKSVSPQVESKLNRMNAEIFEKQDKRDDTPAFIRLGQLPPEPLEKPTEPEPPEKPKLTPEQDRIRKTNSDTPAFLRKIVD
ncbi:MAG: cell division protein FtsZ [Chloroherpetonaceae bacterium]|nr:cell division protein FtsZ [Chloroherpetonaceae bacterium]MCS7210598.1 cell division protein FtsZ [Chloroherpetonaceae bacterium]MDW8020196.1 cell division protein FtsZ [Chloroherpetonaceae bacterium]